MIGFVTQWHGWGWDGWNALVALGTIGLASATGALAWITYTSVKQSGVLIELSKREVAAVETQTQTLVEQTKAVRGQAEATQRQVEISSASLEAAARPVLVGIAPTPASSGRREEVRYTAGLVVDVEIERIHYQADENTIYCSVPLRNVGTGVAFVQRVGIQGNYADGRVSHAVVPPGELTRARFALARKDSAGQPTRINEIAADSGRGFAQFMIYVVYTAASRDLVTGSEVTVSGLPDGTFLVTGNEIYDRDAGPRELLASSANVG